MLSPSEIGVQSVVSNGTVLLVVGNADARAGEVSSDQFEGAISHRAAFHPEFLDPRRGKRREETEVALGVEAAEAPRPPKRGHILGGGGEIPFKVERFRAIF